MWTQRGGGLARRPRSRVIDGERVVGDESAVRVEDGDVADALNARGAIKVGKFAAVGDVVGDGVAENGEVGADLMRAAGARFARSTTARRSSVRSHVNVVDASLNDFIVRSSRFSAPGFPRHTATRRFPSKPKRASSVTDAPSPSLKTPRTRATYSFRISRASIFSRILFAASGVLASNNNPDTFLSNLCIGSNRPKSLLAAAKSATTVFFRYCPVGCTGTVAGLHTDTTSSLTFNTFTSSETTGGSCL